MISAFVAISKMPERGQATLEICVDTPGDFDLALAAGVDRIELCSALGLGGLTPTPGLIRHAASSPVPVYAMIRPRAGNFCFSNSEVDVMMDEIQHVRDAGLAGVVLGASDGHGALDEPVLSVLCQAAQGLGQTLHRVVDTITDPVTAVLTAQKLGFERILTSGGAPKAIEGQAVIGRMIETASNDIEIMAGSGVLGAVVPDLWAVGVRSFHGSCSQVLDSNGTRAIDVQALAQLQEAIRQAARASDH